MIAFKLRGHSHEVYYDHFLLCNFYSWTPLEQLIFILLGFVAAHRFVPCDKIQFSLPPLLPISCPSQAVDLNSRWVELLGQQVSFCARSLEPCALDDHVRISECGETEARAACRHSCMMPSESLQ